MASTTIYTRNIACLKQLHEEYGVYLMLPVTQGTWPVPTSYTKNMACSNAVHEEYALYQPCTHGIWALLSSYLSNKGSTMQLNEEYGSSSQFHKKYCLY